MIELDDLLMLAFCGVLEAPRKQFGDRLMLDLAK
jgi:hypothetical protein